MTSSADASPTTAALEAQLLQIARDAARASARVLLGYYGNATGVRTKSTDTDLVSEADVNAELAIRALLAERRPGDAILGEEGGETSATGESGIRWIVDPLDGTVNYLFQYPQWSVSIAAADAGGTVAGIVWDPIRQEEFAATRSGQPTLNGAPLIPSAQDDLGQVLISTGFAYDARLRARQAEIVSGLITRVRDIRRGGSAALDLCWAAAGRTDAYYERGINAWDYAAGALICERAGLAVRDLPADHELPFGLVVAPPALIDHLHALVIG
ncbi:inositol monophosphatase family protein [Conexibacter sp. CPCC 206217]|uniref:inositol monophosphatase family protein n=1 Tax=Conexibacter sp. CPCC 206217 TaxID=3064574 RepID=UPI002716BD7A|nr:inositol monophosphatase family protein [Conexibacter sp. CPCC 206217]MDO8213444.1 inositol monophosphatase family protein [Conexibacter sp. CPCC 206217]